MQSWSQIQRVPAPYSYSNQNARSDVGRVECGHALVAIKRTDCRRG